MAQLALMIDLTRCIGCGSCEAACKLEHHLGPGQFRTRILTLIRPDDPERLEFVKAVCQQCERPACMRACGADAIRKSPLDGIVTVAAERRAAGLSPACVSVCPANALSWGPVDELHARARADKRVERSVDHFGLRPSTVYLEHAATRTTG